MLDTPQEVWELLFGGKFLLEIRQTWLAAALLPLTLILASVPAAANAFSPLTDSVGGTVQQQEATATAVPTVPTVSAAPTPAPTSAATVTPAAPTVRDKAEVSPQTTPTANVAIPRSQIQAVQPGLDAIEAEWQRQGGSSGILGIASTPAECGLVQDGCRRQFQNGKIHWKAATGAFSTSGTIAAKWADYGEAAGRLGFPTSSQACDSVPGSCRQSFDFGYIVSTSNIGTFAVYAPYSRVWSELGASGGRLGVPTAPEVCEGSGAGCSQQFQRGSIVWAAGYGTAALYEPYFGIWASSGKGSGRLGYPTSNEACTAAGSGCVQQFQRGYIAWVPGAGTTMLDGIYASVWASQGRESGRLGFPVSAEKCGLVNSGCYRSFTGGSIYWNAGNGAFPVYGGYAQSWSKYGREAGRMGYPVSSEQCGLSGSGCVQSFQGGYVYWAAGIGFHAVYGVYGQVWGSKRAQDGAMGYPIDDESCQSNSCTQRFEGGSIQWTAGRGTSLRYSEWGYCRALNVGATKYSGGGANRVSFAVSQGYGTTPITFTNCVKSGGRYVHDWTVSGYAGESGFNDPALLPGRRLGNTHRPGHFR